MKKALYTAMISLVATLWLSTTNAMNNTMDNTYKMPFTEQAWKEAQMQADQITLIVVHADWCPTCRAQNKVINAYFQDNPHSKIKQLIIDFDTQKEWVTYFKAPRQSTLLLYKGDQQLWFSVAETRRNKIFQALSSAESGM
ncbi:thioredoxin family protein [Vibrio sp. HDW18]|uniref:thioredoxin family protein n=1 Tax=Vibrio sp. HDW18 TaxID=2714948 RepID=UPI00197EF945|nr:thioredoxin family protein [Vibrio sp. HDW18]